MAFLRSTISVSGLYDYDNTIFDDFKLPDGIDPGILTGNLLVELAELEVVYPNPVVMKTAIRMWSTSLCPIWEKLLSTTKYEYNPIYNTDRSLWHKEQTTRQVTRENEHSNTETRDLTTEGNGSNEASGTDTRSVSGYNEEGFTNADKDETSQNVKTTSNANENGTIGNSGNESGKENETVTHEWGEHSQGNIGVTTTQQMIKEERDVVKFNIIDYIITDFKNRFCILVY